MRLIGSQGSEPIWWAAEACGGSRHYVGKVLVRIDSDSSLHPFAVYDMTSVDGVNWNTCQGAYCKTRKEAERLFMERVV